MMTLFDLRQNVLHRLEEEALARHVLGLGIFVVDLEEPLRFALRLEHDPRLVALGVFDDLGRLAFGRPRFWLAY